MSSIRKILVATDFSQYADEAIDLAVDLSRKYNAPITVATVVQPLVAVVPSVGTFMPADYDDRLLKDAESLIATVVERIRKMGASDVTSRVIMGTPFLELVYLAHEGSFDLVVMGTHGRTGLKHALLGSVAEQVVRHCGCAVLTVRHTEMKAPAVKKT